MLLLFGFKWLKNAIQRYSGLKLLHDEEAIYAANLAQARARGEAVSTRLDPFGVLLSYKSVLLEGLEVAFIIISFGRGSGLILIVGVLATLVSTLSREIERPENKQKA